MENKTKKRRILSASRLKTFLSCSWVYYCEYILKIPSATHPKTKIGSLAHTIFEVLQNPRHKKHYDAIMNTEKRSIYNSKAITRLVEITLKRNPDITEKISNDLDSLVIVGLDNDFFLDNAVEKIEPEREFLMDIDGMLVRGFIDMMGIYENHVKIRDYKSQGKLFTKDEMENNIQAGIYQLYANREFKKPAEVEFVMLRHAPTKKNPTKHLQVVEPYTEAELEGVILYLKYLDSKIQNFDLDTAKSCLKASSGDTGFCNYVCGFKDPMTYYVKLDKDGEIVESSKEKIEEKEGFTVKKMEYKGCPFFYNDNGERRNFK